jgi:hypothetical protein
MGLGSSSSNPGTGRPGAGSAGPPAPRRQPASNGAGSAGAGYGAASARQDKKTVIRSKLDNALKTGVLNLSNMVCSNGCLFCVELLFFCNTSLCHIMFALTGHQARFTCLDKY